MILVTIHTILPVLFGMTLGGALLELFKLAITVIRLANCLLMATSASMYLIIIVDNGGQEPLLRQRLTIAIMHWA